MTRADIDMDTVYAQYVGTALWSETDDDEEPLDGLYTESDFTDEARERMRADCQDFVTSVSAERPDAFDNMDDEQIGHDFWLTRNGHGAGFWDRGSGEVGDYLTREATVRGEQSVYVGDDGALHVA